MLVKTHLAVGLAVALYFLPFINSKLIFIPVVLLASLLPDIDSGFSTAGKHAIFRPLQWITNHRGIIHSYTVCIAAAIALAFFYPVLSFPFFLGYSFHLVLDSFTPKGIRPFWPLKGKSTGKIVVGGRIEDTILVMMIIVNVALLIRFFF